MSSNPKSTLIYSLRILATLLVVGNVFFSLYVLNNLPAHGGCDGGLCAWSELLMLFVSLSLWVFALPGPIATIYMLGKKRRMLFPFIWSFFMIAAGIYHTYLLKEVGNFTNGELFKAEFSYFFTHLLSLVLSIFFGLVKPSHDQ